MHCMRVGLGAANGITTEPPQEPLATVAAVTNNTGWWLLGLVGVAVVIGSTAYATGALRGKKEGYKRGYQKGKARGEFRTIARRRIVSSG